LNLVLSEDISVRNGTLIIKGDALPKFRIHEELGRGANGVVFAAEHVHLSTPCAIKLWIRLRSKDQRDKTQQGLYEARKLAAADRNWAAQIYDADVLNGVFYSSMQLIRGVSLKQHLERTHSKEHLLALGRLYLNGIAATTTESTAHGDAHTSNVLLHQDFDEDGDEVTKMKFIDFGTSLYVEPERWRERHWSVAQETIMRILAPFETLHKSMELYGEFLSRPEHLKVAYWWDVLSDLKPEARLTFY
jgi:serine/threonine protein kinase